jgi:hypothetical protein
MESRLLDRWGIRLVPSPQPAQLRFGEGLGRSDGAIRESRLPKANSDRTLNTPLDTNPPVASIIPGQVHCKKSSPSDRADFPSQTRPPLAVLAAPCLLPTHLLDARPRLASCLRYGPRSMSTPSLSPSQTMILSCFTGELVAPFTAIELGQHVSSAIILAVSVSPNVTL